MAQSCRYAEVCYSRMFLSVTFLQGCHLVCTTSFLGWPQSQASVTHILVSGEACLSWVDQPRSLAIRTFLHRAWAVVGPCGKPNLVWVLYFQILGFGVFRMCLVSARPGFGFLRRRADAWSVRSISGAGNLLYFTSRVSFCLYYNCASQVMY